MMSGVEVWWIGRMRCGLCLLAAVIGLAGCGDGDDDAPPIGDDDTIEETPTPAPSPGLALSLSVTWPETQEKKVGYEGQLEGRCSLAGALIEIAGDLTAYSICEPDGTWAATLDFTQTPVGEVGLELALVQGEQRSESLSQTYVKADTGCDTESQREALFANLDSGADGVEIPYVICTSVQLASIKDYPDKRFALQNDIDLHGTPFYIDATLTGELDGGDFAIRNLRIARPENDDVGLFTYISDQGTVRNLTLANVDVLGNNQVGALVGRLRGDGTVVNVAVSGVIEGVANVGGLAGYFDSVNQGVSLSGLVMAVTVTGDRRVGGVLGSGQDSQEHAIALNGLSVQAAVHGNANYVGGVAGSLYGTALAQLSNIEAAGTVSSSGGYHVGGLVGRGRYITIADSSFEGTVSSQCGVTSCPVGGLLGYAAAGSTIERAEVLADVSSTGGELGGLVGRFGGMGIWSSSHEGAVTTRSGGENDVQARYVGGLIGSTADATELELIDVSHTGNVLVTGQVQSSATGGLVGYLSGTDVSLENVLVVGDVTNDTPEGPNVGGLIGYLGKNDGAGLSSIIDCEVRGAVGGETAREVGGLVGVAYVGMPGLEVQGSRYEGSVTAGTTTGYDAGGLFGYLGVNGQDEIGVQLTVENCQAEGALTSATGYNVGGLFGQLDLGNRAVADLSNLTTDQSITLTRSPIHRVGGLFGYINGGSNVALTLSGAQVSTGLEGAEDYVGGMVGNMNMGANADLSLLNLSAAGTVRAGGRGIGGLIGYISVGANSTVAMSGLEASGAVTGDDEATAEASIGGLMGETTFGSGSTVVLDGLTASGGVVANNHNNVGGLFGYLCANGGDSTGTVSLQRAQASGAVAGSGTYVGGLVGYACFGPGEVLSLAGSTAAGEVSGISAVGGLLGGYRGTGDGALSVSSSSASGDIALEGSYSGGLVGYSRLEDTATATYSDCFATGDVAVQTGEYHGGLIGLTAARLSITRSYATGDVIGHGHYQGGLVGGSDAANQTISSCFATGEVYSANESGNLGGLAGRFRGVIAASFATGDVSGTSYVGGLVGYFYTNDAAPPMDDCYYTGTVLREYGSTASTEVFGHIYGGENGQNALGNALYYNSDFPVMDGNTGEALMTENGSGDPLSGAQLADPASFDGFDFNTGSDLGWIMPSSSYKLPESTADYGYPILAWME